MEMHGFWVFALSSLLLNITPGNDMLYVASRSVTQGSRAGVVSALGIMTGCLVHILAAVVGFSAIIASSATAFDIVKTIGAAYLVYLGLQSFFSRKAAFLPTAPDAQLLSYRSIYVQGIITNVLNPKVVLFFLAFLPQFMEMKSEHPQIRILLWGIWFDCSGTMVNIMVALLFGKMRSWLGRSPRFLRIQQKITGLMLFGLGIKLAFTSKK